MEEKIMKSTFISVILAITIICPCRAATKQAEDQINQRVKKQVSRLQDIKELVSIERQRIEDWYTHSLNELRQLAAERAQEFEKPVRVVWTEFIKESNQIPYADGYFSTTHPTFVRDRETYQLRVALSDIYFLDTAQAFLLDKEAHKLLASVVNTTNRKDSVIWNEAYKMLTIMEELQSQSMRLQSRRKFLLTQLEQWEKDCRKNVFTVKRRALAMIDGEIIYEGSTINNVKVVKIHRYRVEFEKNGKNWVQSIGQPANSAWPKGL
jgi:hypothetical protein